MNRANLRFARYTAAVTVAVVVLFVVLVFWLRSVVVAAGDTEQHVREAGRDRSAILSLQIDEETGLRGYAANGLHLFLAPYTDAVQRFPRSYDALQTSLRALHMSDARALAERENRINATWLSEIAAPTLRGDKSLALQIRGKQLVDDFRSVNAAIDRLLVRRAEAADASSEALANVSAFVLLPIGILVLGALTFAAVRQRLLEQRLREREIQFESERAVALALEGAFVAQTLPVHHRVEMSAAYRPSGLAGRVGGDWYDAVMMSPDRVLLCVGDVAGHGIDAAIAMSRVRQSILTIAAFESDPAVVFTKTNELLGLYTRGSMVTAVCGFLDLQTLTLRYSIAGHPPLLAAGADGSVQQLPYGSGPPLGVLDEAAYVSHTFAAQPGMLLVGYTDGVLEYDRDVQRGETLLASAVAAAHGAAPGNEAAHIMRTIFDGVTPVDDAAVLAARLS